MAGLERRYKHFWQWSIVTKEELAGRCSRRRMALLLRSVDAVFLTTTLGRSLAEKATGGLTLHSIGRQKARRATRTRRAVMKG
jgi:hypothetical protein